MIAIEDAEHWKCTTSSSCKQSCVRFFITIQFIIIFILIFTLRSFRTTNEHKKHYKADNEILKDRRSNQNNSRWVLKKDKMERLNENPVYARFHIARRLKRPRLTLLLIVSSAPKRSDRRLAIRDTWWTDCHSNEKVTIKCIFMTDFVDNSTVIGRNLLKEQIQYKDVEFQNLKGGVEFGKRFIFHMLWAMQNYDFEYFLRMDDDYFFCLQTFLHQIPIPKPSLYHWGYVHCQENIVRPEESIILLSRDLVEIFLGQDPETMMCHPWADQMIGIWTEALKLNNLYNHDNRLHHDPPISHVTDFDKKLENACRKHIGIHGSYPNDTRKLWKLRGVQKNIKVQLDEFTVKCDRPQVFKWDMLYGGWRYKPKLCITDPDWDTYKQEYDQGIYGGRQDPNGILRM